jgi:hypothetical protein
LSTEGNYALSETIWNAGTVEVNSGTLNITGIIGGPGTWQIDSGDALTFSGPGTNAENVKFESNTGTLVIASGTQFTGTISGFTGSDKIDLQGINFNSETHTYDPSTGMLIVSDGSHSETFKLIGFNGTLNFAPDSANGTLITDPPAASTTPFADASSSGSLHINEPVSGDGTDAATALHIGADGSSATPPSTTGGGAETIDSAAMSDPGRAPVLGGVADTAATIFNHSDAVSSSNHIQPTDTNSTANGIASGDDNNSGNEPAGHTFDNDFLKLVDHNTNPTWSFSGEGWASNSAAQPPSDEATGTFDRSIHVGFSPSTAINQHHDLGSAAQQDVFTFAATFAQADNGRSGSVIDHGYSQHLFDTHFNNSAAHAIAEILVQAAQVAPTTVMHGPELAAGAADMQKESPLTHYFHV